MLLAALSLGACGTSYEGEPTVTYKALPATNVALSCNLAGRAWTQRSPAGCVASTWRFVRLTDGTWQASETGCGGARGKAIYDGAVVTVSFSYAGGAGVYTWPLDVACRSVPGKVRWTVGPNAGRTVVSTLAPTP